MITPDRGDANSTSGPSASSTWRSLKTSPSLVVLTARNNANEDGLHYLYAENNKIGHIHHAIIFRDSEIYTYSLTIVIIALPTLPQLEQTMTWEDCHVFQTWQSNVLHSSNVIPCFRSSLSLYVIDVPNGCPTHYRKAASTLISLYKPELQETLSQLICHSRSTTENHYRTHMAHEEMYEIFRS